jgi:hypothetical protein
MGFPSGTYNRPASGKLQITFSGKFTSSVGGGAPGWYGGNSGAFVRILCTAGSKQTVITSDSPTNVIELDYTASTALSVSMSLIGSNIGGVGTVRAEELLIRCILMKR